MEKDQARRDSRIQAKKKELEKVKEERNKEKHFVLWQAASGETS